MNLTRLDRINKLIQQNAQRMARRDKALEKATDKAYYWKERAFNNPIDERQYWNWDSKANERGVLSREAQNLDETLRAQRNRE